MPKRYAHGLIYDETEGSYVDVKNAETEVGGFRYNHDGTVDYRSQTTQRLWVPAKLFHPAASGGPVVTEVGNIFGLGCDANTEVFYYNWMVPRDWDAASDINVYIVWYNEAGAALAPTETVEWNIAYNSAAASATGGETHDVGTGVTAVATHTQGAATGTDKSMYVTQVTLDYDDANAVIAAGDQLNMKFNRDATADSYASDAIFVGAYFEYTRDQLFVG